MDGGQTEWHGKHHRTLKERVRDISPRPLVSFVRRLRYRRHLRVKRTYLAQQAASGRYCFIHINKCGGTSVEKALGIPVKIHDTALERRAVVGEARWNEMASFSIVRHPYDRLCSDYRYRIKTNQSGMAERPIALNNWIVRVLRDRDPVYFIKPRMFMPCHEWLCDESGRIIVDFVGRLEMIERDWPRIQQLTGNRAPLPMRNRTHGVGAGGELDRASKDLIAEVFDLDFTVFGYQR